MQPIEQISVADYARLRAAGDEEHLLLDVRQPEEWAICHIEGAKLLPLRELPQRHEELAEWKERPVYCLCHHGGRSAQAAMYLAQQGYGKVVNVAGGIHQWALQVDPETPTY